MFLMLNVREQKVKLLLKRSKKLVSVTIQQEATKTKSRTPTCVLELQEKILAKGTVGEPSLYRIHRPANTGLLALSARVLAVQRLVTSVSIDNLGILYVSGGPVWSLRRSCHVQPVDR